MMVRGMGILSIKSLIAAGCIWTGPVDLDMFSFFKFFFLTVSVSMRMSSILIWQYYFISLLSLFVSMEKRCEVVH